MSRVVADSQVRMVEVVDVVEKLGGVVGAEPILDRDDDAQPYREGAFPAPDNVLPPNLTFCAR